MAGWRPLSVAAIALSVPATAAAQGIGEAPYDDDAPAPVVLRTIPPRFSWNVGVSVSYGMLPQLGAPSFLGFGVRGAWGRHWDNHRLGLEVSTTIEGPLAVEWSHILEPAIAWDWVAPYRLFLGASLGPSGYLNLEVPRVGGPEPSWDAGAFAAFRIGYSQNWAMGTRRFWVAIEPKVRWVDGAVGVLGSIVLGSGNGY